MCSMLCSARHATMLSESVWLVCRWNPVWEVGGWVSVVCCLEFSSLMACEKKLSRVLLVLVQNAQGSRSLLWSSVLSSHITGCEERSLEGGKLTSNDVLGCLNYSMQGFPDENGAVPVPGGDAASQDALHSATEELSEDFWARISSVAWGRRRWWAC